MFMWSTEASQFFLTKLSGLQGLDFVEVCTLPVSFGEWLLAQLSGDGSTCRVWCLSRVLGTGNTGVTGTGEAGLTSPTGIAECCSVSVSFTAATKAERFLWSVPLSVVTDQVRSGKIRVSKFSLSPGHTALDLLSKPSHLVQVLAVPLLYDACQSCTVGFFYQLVAFYLHIRVQLRRPLHLQEAAYLLAWAGQQEHMRVYLQWLDVFLVHIGLNSCIS